MGFGNQVKLRFACRDAVISLERQPQCLMPMASLSLHERTLSLQEQIFTGSACL